MSKQKGADANSSAPQRKYDRCRVNERVAIFKDTSKSPFWQMDYSKGGKQFRTSTGTDIKKVAVELANRKYKELVLGTETIQPATRVKVTEAIEKFLTQRQQKRKSAPNTIKTYRANLNDFDRFLKAKGVDRIDQIRPDHVDEFEEYLRRVASEQRLLPGQAGKEMNKSGTLHNKLVVMKQLLKYAVAKDWIDRDPARKFEMPKRVHTQAYCWSADELAAIINHVPAGREDEFDFLRFTGLRAGEFCWTRKEDVDVGKRLLRVCEKEDPVTGQKWKPKTGDGRLVPLCDEAMAIVQRRLASDDSPWLFTRPNRTGGLTRLTRGQLRDMIKAAMKKAGVERGTTHTCRHKFCSFIANSGVQPFVAMKIMGHRSLDIILMYYHLDEQELLLSFKPVDFGKMLKQPDVGNGAGGGPQLTT